ncbi:uncharacterized protein ATC70_006889 [Mucor velutinosus]|uniref:CAP-Gly domain-containing protein n=1 Tax=Mucor velutinosus TaxID=708070 RepID=A0AAN7DRS1_9FUNG|nr:hypothetical protein ATC70_006889 [Mucor velutinosus]
MFIMEANVKSDISSYGPSNVVVALGPQKVPTKRRLSQSKLPMNQKVARRRRRFDSSSSSKSVDQGDDGTEEDEDTEEDEGFDHTSDSDNDQKTLKKQPTRWSCHTHVLYKESPYFASLFGENFIESKASIVYLPSSIIDRMALYSILRFMYTHQINKPKTIKELCNMYSAADYLGMEKLCIMLTEIVIESVHHCICYCTSCIANVPELFPFCRTRSLELQDEKMAVMTQKVITILASDPEKTLSTYWTSRHMALLLIQLPQDVSQALSQKVLHRVNKSNAIESLYSCFTASNTLSTNDPLLSWSKPLHATLTSVQSRATKIIARHFDFYCCQYPALLSCIDGITYSFDFLEYLLLHILEDQMDCSNVGILYQGIVCDLMSRHAVQHNDQVKHILSVAKVMVLHYITRRISDIRQQGGLDKLDKAILKLLADDLDVRPKSLISSNHPLFHRGIFSFLLPSIPTLHLSTSTHTNGLSRHSSRSTLRTTSGTTATRRVSLPVTNNENSSASASPSFASQLTRLLKKIGSSHHRRRYSSSASATTGSSPQQQRLANRTLSTSTVRTSISTSSTSWSQVRLTDTKKERSISFSSIKHRKLLRGQVSAPMVGMHRRVQLTRRPTLTVGTVEFIGHVEFADGIWIGVELDRRVGKNDGSVDGHRYFTSSPNRGVFVRPEDISLVV